MPTLTGYKVHLMEISLRSPIEHAQTAALEGNVVCKKTVPNVGQGKPRRKLLPKNLAPQTKERLLPVACIFGVDLPSRKKGVTISRLTPVSILLFFISIQYTRFA